MEHTIKLDQSGQHNAKINRATRVTCSNLSRHMFIHTFAEMDTMEDLVIDSLGERCFNTGGEKVFGMIIAIISTNRNGVVTNAMQEVGVWNYECNVHFSSEHRTIKIEWLEGSRINFKLRGRMEQTQEKYNDDGCDHGDENAESNWTCYFAAAFSITSSTIWYRAKENVNMLIKLTQLKLKLM